MISDGGSIFKGSTLTYRTRDSLERGCLFFCAAPLRPHFHAFLLPPRDSSPAVVAFWDFFAATAGLEHCSGNDFTGFCSQRETPHDSTGQIHLVETGLALIPGVDEYEIVK